MKIVLNNHQLLGDTLMMTCGVRDFKKQFPENQIRVNTNYSEIWDNNPHLTEFDTPDTVLDIGPRIVTQGSNSNGLHFCNGYRVCIETKLGISIKQGPLKPEIFLSEAEKNKKVVEGSYWIINIDCGGYRAKQWSNERWQEVVDRLSWITFVQVGLSGDNEYRLKGKNVIDFVGKTQKPRTGLRDLFTLFYHSEGSIGLVSSHMHISAAFEKPCVIVAGAREPVTFEQYSWHRYIQNQGSLKCSRITSCWKCGNDRERKQ